MQCGACVSLNISLKFHFQILCFDTGHVISFFEGDFGGQFSRAGFVVFVMLFTSLNPLYQSFPGKK